MATFNKFDQFVENIMKGVHNFNSDASCTITVALTAAANPPVAGDTVLGGLTQISYTNCSSRVVTVTSCEQTSGTVKLILADLVLTAGPAAMPAFRYVVLYDDDPTSPADPLIGWYDYGTDLTLQAGETLTLDFSPSTGVIQIT